MDSLLSVEEVNKIHESIINDMILKAQDMNIMERLYKAFDMKHYRETKDESLNLTMKILLFMEMEKILKINPNDFDRKIQLSGI